MFEPGLRWKEDRRKAGLTQARAAVKLGVSQPYLSMLEHGRRNPSNRLTRKLLRLYVVSPAQFPVTVKPERLPVVKDQDLAKELAALGYPGFAYMRTWKLRNPAEVLTTALAQPDLETRVVEALPWVLLRFTDLDWEWVKKAATRNSLQNRLGFVTTLAFRLAQSDSALSGKAETLVRYEQDLEAVRLNAEDTLCKSSLTSAERSWLEQHRPPDAARWHLLTDLSPQHLSHAV